MAEVLTVSNVRIGVMEFTLDDDGNITGWTVSKIFDVVDGGFSATMGQNVDVWPNLTQGQRNQAQGIKDSIMELLEA